MISLVEGLEHVTGAPWRLPYGCADAFYIPQNLTHDFITMMGILVENEVFMEIAIGTVLAAISRGQYQQLSGNISDMCCYV